MDETVGSWAIEDTTICRFAPDNQTVSLSMQEGAHGDSKSTNAIANAEIVLTSPCKQVPLCHIEVFQVLKDRFA